MKEKKAKGITTITRNVKNDRFSSLPVFGSSALEQFGRRRAFNQNGSACNTIITVRVDDGVRLSYSAQVQIGTTVYTTRVGGGGYFPATTLRG